MAVEIERKFLVVGDEWREGRGGTLYRQGYLNSEKERVVRVRVMGDHGRITVKGINQGMRRLEFEYPIPSADAAELMEELCERPIIEKTRYTRLVDGLEWVIDEFHGENDGLIVAEVELDREDQQILIPHWAGKEVTDDVRYFNSNLLANPYKNWQ